MADAMDKLALQFKEMFGNAGIDAFELEWGFAKYIDTSLVPRESGWIAQAYEFLKIMGYTSEENSYDYNDMDNHAWIHETGVGPSVVIKSQTRNYIFTLEFDDGPINILKTYEHQKTHPNPNDKRTAEEVAEGIAYWEEKAKPRVHIRRFWDKKDSDEKKGNSYPQRPLLKSMYMKKPAYLYLDLRDTGYVWSTGELTPKLYDFREVKYSCGELNSLLANIQEEGVKVNFNFISGTVKYKK